MAGFLVSPSYVSEWGDSEDVEYRGKIPYLNKSAEGETCIRLLRWVNIRAKHLLSSYYVPDTEFTFQIYICLIGSEKVTNIHSF